MSTGGVTEVCGHPEESPRHKGTPSLIREPELQSPPPQRQNVTEQIRQQQSRQGKKEPGQGPGQLRFLTGILRGFDWITSHTNCRLEVSNLSY